VSASVPALLIPVLGTSDLTAGFFACFRVATAPLRHIQRRAVDRFGVDVVDIADASAAPGQQRAKIKLKPQIGDGPAELAARTCALWARGGGDAWAREAMDYIGGKHLEPVTLTIVAGVVTLLVSLIPLIAKFLPIAMEGGRRTVEFYSDPIGNTQKFLRDPAGNLSRNAADLGAMMDKANNPDAPDNGAVPVKRGPPPDPMLVVGAAVVLLVLLLK